MAWRRDPATGEWEMVDPMTPDPNTQGLTGQEPDPSARNAPVRPPPPLIDYPPDEGGGYRNPNMRRLPDHPQPVTSEYPPDTGGYADPDLRGSPGLTDPSMGGGYQNEDYTAVDQWVQEVQARGNQIVHTAAGTFETADGVTILSEMPKSSYRMN